MTRIIDGRTGAIYFVFYHENIYTINSNQAQFHEDRNVYEIQLANEAKKAIVSRNHVYTSLNTIHTEDPFEITAHKLLLYVGVGTQNRLPSNYDDDQKAALRQNVEQLVEHFNTVSAIFEKPSDKKKELMRTMSY